MNHKQDYHAEEQLEDALALLAAGLPLETVLSEAGVEANWLRPLLEMAGEVTRLQPGVPIPPPEASLQTLLAHGRKLAQPPRPKSRPMAGWWAIFNPPRLAGGFRGALVAVSLVTAFLAGTVLGGGLTMAAQDSLPGQRFYGLKRMGESIQLSLVVNPNSRDQLLQTYNHRRRFEAELLLQQGQRVMVAFEGKIEVVNDQAVAIHGLTVQLGPDTAIEGDLVPGALVHLEAITQPPEALLAIKISVIQPGPATPTPTPSPTATALPSPTATATGTPTPSTAQDADTLALPSPIPTDDMPPPLDEPPDIDADPSPAPAPADDNDNVWDDFDNDNFDDDLDNEPDEDFDDDDDDNRDDGDNSNSGSDDGDTDNSNDNDGDNDNDDDNSNDNDDDNGDDDNSGKSSSDDEDKSGKSSDDDDDKS
jgi:hypothetical protein